MQNLANLLYLVPGVLFSLALLRLIYPMSRRQKTFGGALITRMLTMDKS
jgi:hypothetical protein